MLKFLRKNKLIALWMIMSIGLLTAVITSTMSWFSVQMEINPPTSGYTSGILTSYFDSGTGTSNDPYVITRPIHFYHLSYLQNSDYFGNDEKYFQFGKKNLNGSGNTDYRFYEYNNSGVAVANSYVTSLNMDCYNGQDGYSKLVPIGTAEHPFKGHINGANLTVNNVHINGDGLCDIGIFGYVTATATINHIYFDNVDIDTGGPIGTHTSHSHTDGKYNVGYIAGHIADEDSFNGVYINNCKAYNSKSPSVTGKAHYGYFGLCDSASTPMTMSSSDQYRIVPNTVHSYMNDVYSGLSGKAVATRPLSTEYTPSNVSFASAFSKTNSNYDLKGKSSGASYNYSLSTIGHQGMDAVYDIRYDNSTPKKLMDEDTIVVPENQDINSISTDGTYMYYDTANSVWKYYVINSGGSTTTQTFNVFKLSYEYNSTTYYVYYDSSTTSLKASTTNPSISNTNYWFCFKEALSNSDLGVTSFTDHDSTKSYYMYIPAEDSYIYITSSNTFNVGSATDVANLSNTNGNTGSFKIDGVDSHISWLGKYNSQNATYAFQGVGTTINLIRPVADNTATTFAFNGTSARTSSSTSASSEFLLITDISEIVNGMQIGICASEYYKMLSTTQNTNNRGVVVPTDLSDEEDGTVLSNATGTAILTVSIRDNNGTTEYSLYDPANTGYLYAASSSSNYLRTRAGECWWTLSINESNYNAVLTSQYNDFTHNIMRYNHGSDIFSCYATGQDPIQLYKYHETSGTLITANAGSITVEISGGGQVTRTPYDAYYDNDPTGLNDYKALDFSRERITWDFENSQITVAPVGNSYWEMITSNDDLTDGNYLVVANGSNCALDGSAATINSTSAKIAVTITNYTIPFSTETNNASFTYNATNKSFKTTNDTYLSNSGSSGSINTSNSEITHSTVSVASSGVATITYSSQTLKYNSSWGGFRYYSSGQQDVQLYKLVSESNDPEYISDAIEDLDNQYDHTKIDIVGDATFTSSTINIASDLSNIKAVSKWHADNSSDGINAKFYQTKYLGNSVVFFIPNQGALDFGTIHFTCTSSAAPVFVKGTHSGNANWESSIQFSDSRIGCSNDSVANNTYDYTISLNKNNIFNLCYAALNSSGNIAACYDADGAKVLPSSSVSLGNISTFVLAISVPSSTMNVSTINLKINHISGMMANYNSVGYRSATYTSGTSIVDDLEFNNVNAASVIDREVIDYRFDSSNNSNRIYEELTYNSSTKTYELTFKCSVATHLYIFNFDAERVVLKVNDTIYKESYHDILVNASNWWQ